MSSGERFKDEAAPSTHRHRQFFTKCAVDGFINWSRPYGTFASALDETTRLDARFSRCGPHSVHIQEWLTNDDPGSE